MVGLPSAVPLMAWHIIQFLYLREGMKDGLSWKDLRKAMQG